MEPFNQNDNDILYVLLDDIDTDNNILNDDIDTDNNILNTINYHILTNDKDDNSLNKEVDFINNYNMEPDMYISWLRGDTDTKMDLIFKKQDENVEMIINSDTDTFKYIKWHFNLNDVTYDYMTEI
jgi:hypothetical protein